MTDPLTAYAAVLERARADPEVMGVVMTGSRGGGAFVTDRSDVDLRLVTLGSAEAWSTPHGSPVEIWAMSLEAFRGHGRPGTPIAWDRPSFLHCRVELDRLDGEIARLVAEKARLDAAEAHAIAADALDDYLNALYRSLRNLEGGRALEGRLDGIESLGPLLTTLFALEERVRPYNKWLRVELERRPLAFGEVLASVEAIGRDPTPDTQRAMFRRLEAAAREAGHGVVIDGWEPDVAWLRRGSDAGDLG